MPISQEPSGVSSLDAIFHREEVGVIGFPLLDEQFLTK
ncbi:hypothetical protein Nhal_1249 [Nitrosococcus halophilus Nc 4]|uniref:Uncharacterized protein n=1 Tax=Nitrosococcus halophilus (strain Nc4) TaxID=472759 RepID=D5C084_NITHN|nr:hypothetical protein Nhal_1249 [Nitrosococcus halophilus Nc 4]